MKTYFSTFITGFDDLIKVSLMDKLDDVDIDYIEDGLIIYKTSADINVIKNIGFLNNSYVLISLLKNINLNCPEVFIESVIGNVSLGDVLSKYLPNKKVSFRVVISKENEIIGIQKSLLNRIEKVISNNSSLVVDRTNPTVEFWFLLRRSGLGLFGMRVTRHRDYKKILAKGELRPELAHILCLLSEPNPNDIFLDPFTGSMSIPIKRLKLFPYKSIFAGDINLLSRKYIEQKLGSVQGKIKYEKLDALNLKGFKEGSITKIVTDPPWGITLGRKLNLNQFYSQILKEFSRILSPGGILVVLIAKKDLFDEILNNFSEYFLAIGKYDTLVNGKKARVYKLSRRK